MSWPALTWAKAQRVGSSSEKAVLLALAYRHNEDFDMAYPSVSSIAEFTELDPKTINCALRSLREKGLIEDSGERFGRTKQIIGYRLPKLEDFQKRNASDFSAERPPKTVDGKTIGKTTSRAKALSVRAKSVEEAIKDRDITADAATGWAVAVEKWNIADAKIEWARFSDSAMAAGRTYKDWMAAWRNWCRSPFCKTKSADDKVAYRKGPWVFP